MGHFEQKKTPNGRLKISAVTIAEYLHSTCKKKKKKKRRDRAMQHLQPIFFSLLVLKLSDWIALFLKTWAHGPLPRKNEVNWCMIKLSTWRSLNGHYYCTYYTQTYRGLCYHGKPYIYIGTTSMALALMNGVQRLQTLASPTQYSSSCP